MGDPLRGRVMVWRGQMSQCEEYRRCREFRRPRKREKRRVEAVHTYHILSQQNLNDFHSPLSPRCESIHGTGHCGRSMLNKGQQFRRLAVGGVSETNML